MKLRIIAALITVITLLTAVAACAQQPNTTISLSDTFADAERYLSEMNYEQALIEFDKILEVEPKNAEAYIGKAEAYIGLNKYDDAADILNECIDKTENINYDRIVEISGRIIEFAPDSITVYLVCSRAYICLDNLEKSIEVLRKGYSLTNNEQLKTMLEQLESGDIDIASVGEQSEPVNEDASEETKSVSELAANMLEAHINKGNPIDKELASEIKYICISGNGNTIYVDTELREDLNPITTGEFWSGSIIHGNRAEIESDVNDISFISEFVNLEYLCIDPFESESYDSHITCKILNDLTPLSKLEKLQKLSIDSGSGITVDLSQFSSLNVLTVLNLFSNVYVKDVNEFGNFPKLTQIKYRSDLKNDSISYLSNLNELELLEITSGYNYDTSEWDTADYEHIGGEIYDLSPLYGLVSLRLLDIDVSTSDLQALGTLTGLKELNIAFSEPDNSDDFYMPIPDFSAFANLKELEELTMFNQTQNESIFTDLSSLSYLSELKYIKIVNDGNRGLQYIDISPLSSLVNLEQIEIHGAFDDVSSLIGLNKIRKLRLNHGSVHSYDRDIDMTSLTNIKSFEDIFILGGYFTDLSGFSDMKDLNRLDIIVMDTTDLTPLYSLSNICSISLRYEQSDYSSEKRDKFEMAIEKLKEHLPDCDISTY